MKILAWLQSLVGSLVSRIAQLFSGPGALRIVTFSPEAGWPGSLVTVQGQGFSADRDANMVTIGGMEALVIEAEPTLLQVLVGAGTTSGLIRVEVNRRQVSSASPFIMSNWPDQGEFGEDGPPRFFDGPQHGSPQTNVPNQKVLVIFCFPTNHTFAAPADAQQQKASEEANFRAANQWWRDVSYDSTSWAFTFTNWVPLPQDRQFYVWEHGDTVDAQRWLLREAVHRAVVSGTRVYVAHLGFALAIVDATTPALLKELSRASLANQGTGVRVVGQYAYVTAGQAGLYVVDTALVPPPLPSLPWPDPTIITQIPTTAWLHGLDVAGNLLVVAAEDAGIIVYDITVPTNPVQLGTLDFGANALATAVRVVGMQAFVTVNTINPGGTAATLRVVDLAIPTGPIPVASVPLPASGLALDIEATRCGVVTDGAGVHFFEVAGPAAPVFRGAFKDVASAYGIDIRGGIAFIAAGGDGLRIVNVSNPSIPTEMGKLMVGAAYDVATDGAGHAYVSVEASELVVVDVSKPSAPTKLNGIDLESSVIPAPFTPDIQGRRALIDVSINNQDKARRPDALWVDAIQLAQGAGFMPDDFEGIIVVLNGPFLRGASTPPPLAQSVVNGEDTIEFASAKGLIYIATNAEVARIAHEIGHWLGMVDLYEERYADGSALLGTAAPWDIGGGSPPPSDGLHLFTGFHIHDVMRFYKTADPNKPVDPDANVEERAWSIGDPALDETFDLVVHGAAEDTNPVPRIHILKLKVAEGLAYYVEVRQKQPPFGGLTFDRTIPLTSAGEARVLLTRMHPVTTFANSRERVVMLLGTLDVGQSWADAARQIEITVEQLVQNTPCVYRVRLRWNQPVVPNGKYDAWITPWVTGKWESEDIWVDSLRNGYGVFESFAPGKPGEATMNGDRPWVGRINLIGARIHNSGPADATNLQVSFYVNSPPGIGDNGSWFTLGTRPIPSIPANGTFIVNHSWVPTVGQHSCLRVEIMPQPNNESIVGNNMAQENVFTFDSAGGSSHQPVVVEAAVRSPFMVWKRVDLFANGLPDGWHAVVDHAWMWLPPKGSRPVRAVIWTDLNTPRGGDRKIPPLAEVSIEGWTDFDHPYLPIGGVLARVKATKRVLPQCDVQVLAGELIVRGCIKPPLAGVPITIEIVDANGARRYLHLATDESGCFTLSPMPEGRGGVRLGRGTYTVQVFVTAGGEAAETECEPVQVHVT